LNDTKSAVVVTVYNPQERALPKANVIAQCFSLTKAEALLCEDLLMGYSLEEVAEKQAKSKETVRSYLKQVFQKTGYKRQGELISAMLTTLMD